MSENLQQNNQIEEKEKKVDVEAVRKKYYSRYKTMLIMDVVASSMVAILTLLFFFVPLFDHLGITSSSVFDELKYFIECISSGVSGVSIYTSIMTTGLPALMFIGAFFTAIWAIIKKSMILNDCDKNFLLWYDSMRYDKIEKKGKSYFSGGPTYTLISAIAFTGAMIAMIKILNSSIDGASEYIGGFSTYLTVTNVTAATYILGVLLIGLLVFEIFKKSQSKRLEEEVVLDGYSEKKI